MTSISERELRELAELRRQLQTGARSTDPRQAAASILLGIYAAAFTPILKSASPSVNQSTQGKDDSHA